MNGYFPNWRLVYRLRQKDREFGHVGVQTFRAPSAEEARAVMLADFLNHVPGAKPEDIEIVSVQRT
jgi:hypothetical protein